MYEVRNTLQARSVTQRDANCLLTYVKLDSSTHQTAATIIKNKNTSCCGAINDAKVYIGGCISVYYVYIYTSRALFTPLFMRRHSPPPWDYYCNTTTTTRAVSRAKQANKPTLTFSVHTLVKDSKSTRRAHIICGSYAPEYIVIKYIIWCPCPCPKYCTVVIYTYYTLTRNIISTYIEF